MGSFKKDYEALTPSIKVRIPIPLPKSRNPNFIIIGDTFGFLFYMNS